MLSLRILTTLKNLKVGDLMIPVLNPLCKHLLQKKHYHCVNVYYGYLYGKTFTGKLLHFEFNPEKI